jgi:hypothetical protein
MKIAVTCYDENSEYHREYSIWVPEDITALDLLKEIQRLMILLGYAVESVNNAFEHIEDL